MATRVNLSLPTDLKERMDKLTDVNWSKIAQETFETHLTINELKGKDMGNEAGIERLRASKKANAERELAEGFSDGRMWALENAEYDELAAVVRLADNENQSMPDARELAEAMGYDSPSWEEAREAMESLFGENEPSEIKIKGFIEGATEIFNKI